MDISIQKLNAVVEELKQTLGDGLLATDIWDFSVGLSLAGHNAQPAAVALFTDVTKHLASALLDAGFPKLSRYYLLDMEGDHTVLILRHGNDLLQGMLLNNKKVNLGILLSIAMPKMFAGVAKARGLTI